MGHVGEHRSATPPPGRPTELDWWSGKRVLLTGHTGFKGAWLHRLLDRLGAQVGGLSLAAEPGGACVSLDQPVDVSSIVDIRNEAAVLARLRMVEPDIVLHLAAQAFVRRSYVEPAMTWAVNLGGTVSLLDAASRLPSAPTILIVTTDKVYRNDGYGRPFREIDELSGHDPYSASKAAVELAAASWPGRGGHPRVVATARAGNVIGGGDVGPDRLVPDALRAFRSGHDLVVRYPDATRPWQHVLEPIVGYLLHARALTLNPETTPRALNFGPLPTEVLPVRCLLELLSTAVGGLRWIHDPGPHPREAASLTLDPSLAAASLGWRTLLSVTEAVEWTVAWSQAEVAGRSLIDVADSQIDSYLSRLSAGAAPLGRADGRSGPP